MVVANWTKRIGLYVASLLLTIGIFIGEANAHSPVTSEVSGKPDSANSSTVGAQVEVGGVLEVLHQDFPKSSRYLYFLRMPDGTRVPLHFKSRPPTNLLTGDYVRVHGQPSGGTLILESGGTNVTVTSKTTSPTATLPNTLGGQSTLVILVNFQDAPDNEPYSVADAQSVVFGTASSFFLENSYQQTWLTGDVVGWYTLPLSSTACDASSIATYAQSAASAAGVDLSAYTHYVYAFPQNNGCGWAGSSYIGGSPSQSWINGDSLDVHTIDHELGHAFGLWHSHLLDCGTSATIGSNCTINEYGDILDTMGASQPSSPHYNAFQKERLGWLNAGASPSITTVQNSGTYTIDTYESGGSGPNALKFLKSIDPTTGAKTWYYVEARQAVGFDAFLTNGTCEPCYTQNETDGVLVHVGTDGDGNSGDLLDITPVTPTYYWWFDPSLAAGQSFADPAAGVTMTTASVTSTEATVTVQFTGAVTVATNQQTYIPGQTVSATATATVGGTPVAKAVVSFAITKANGSVVTATATTGSNGTAVYSLKLRRKDPAGTYQASAAATINGTPRSAATNFTVK
jgi:M6 family metalloprotease-like protein